MTNFVVGTQRLHDGGEPWNAQDAYAESQLVIPRLTDFTFDEAVACAAVLVTYSAPKSCPKCPLQMPALVEVASCGIPVVHVDVEQPDSLRIAMNRPLYLGTPRGRDGSRGDPTRMPDMRVPAHYVFSYGRPVARLTGLTEASNLAGLFEHGQRVAALGMLGSSFWP